ncbi:membrane hypothetical protein [Candidatus Sulfopaludibacter sp. SbA3]|nr:membrane hypothetical protein [Candidatus Sulfopaludibacter sp. SbA3]
MRVAMRKIVVLTGKDLRHIWPHVLVMLPLLVLFTTIDDDTLRASVFLELSTLTLLYLAFYLALWNLVIAIIHCEPLPGDRQYWLTRPFTWYHLAASKVVTIALCVNLPLFILQAAVFAAHGISPLWYVMDLLWLQVFFSAFLLLPAAALASVTRSLGQFTLGATVATIPLLIVLLVTSVSQDNPWFGGMEWVKGMELAAVLAVGCSVILLLQYSRRRALLSRLIFGMTALALVPVGFYPWEGAFAPSGRGTNLDLRLSLNRTFRPPASQRWDRQFGIKIQLPLAVDGLPLDCELALNYAHVNLEMPGQIHRVYRVTLHDWSGHRENWLHGEDLSKDGAVLELLLDRTEYPMWRELDVDLKGRLYFTVMRPTGTLATDRDTIRIPGFGVCSKSEQLCVSPQPHVTLSLVSGGERIGIVAPQETFPPFPTLPLLYPLHRFPTPIYGEMLVQKPITLRPYSFEFRDVHLADFVPPE